MWYCPACVQGIFASNHFDDHDIYCILEAASDCAFHLQEVDSKVFIPFEIDDSLDTSFGDIVDIDMQYHTDMNCVENMKCDYYFEDTFKKKIKGMEKTVSLFHQNIKSLPKKHWWIWIVLKLSGHLLDSLKLGWIKIKKNCIIFRILSADLNEGSLRARHAKARLCARGHLKSFDTPGFRGGISKIFMTLNGYDFRCVQQSAILHLCDLLMKLKFHCMEFIKS